jgi:hypothetical protein
VLKNEVEQTEYRGGSICATCKHSMVMRIRVSSPEAVMTMMNGRPVPTGQVIKCQAAYQFACHCFGNCVWQNPGVEVTSCTEWQEDLEDKTVKGPQRSQIHSQN